MKLILRTCFLLAIMVSFHNHALEPKAPQIKRAAYQALQAAMTDLKVRNKALSKSKKLRFEQREQDRDGNVQIYSKVWSQEKEVVSELIHVNGQYTQTQGLNWSNDVFVQITEEMISSARLVSESDIAWHFRINTPVRANIDDATSSQTDTVRVNASLQSKLITEITVKKSNPRFIGMHIAAPTPFKPSLLSKVTMFDVKLQFEQQAPGGPLFIAHQTRQVKGRYGYFITIDEFAVISRYNLRFIQP